ncbi:MAG: MFS transporter [Aeromonadales bacterium]|nr:MFS transporter [Aeromonadales bacterium]
MIISAKENYYFMFGHFAMDICSGALPIIFAYMYQEGKLESLASVALLMMASTILNAIVQPIAGMLVDSGSRPYIMSIGIFMAFLGVMFLGVVENQVLLYVLVGINGIGSSLFHPAGAKMTNVFGSVKLGKSLSIFSLGGNAGMAFGPFYFTALFMLFGLNATLALCIPGIIIISIYMMKNRYYTIACTKVKLKNKKAQGKSQDSENVKGFLILMAVLFIRSAGWFTFSSFIALYYMHELNVQDEIATLLNGCIGAVGALATFIGGTMSDKIGYNNLVKVASLASIPFICSFIFCDNSISATVCLLPFAFFFFAAMSPSVALGQKFLCNHVGMATGITVGLSMSIGGLVAPIMGRLGDIYGIEATMIAVAIYITLAGLGSLIIPKPNKA